MDAKFCRQCGRELSPGARFCSECGTATASSLPTGQPINLQLDDNVVAFLCYLLPILAPVLTLNMEPFNRKPELRFHAWQSVFFTAAWVALHFALFVVSIPLAVLGLPLASLFSPIIHLALVAAWVYLMVQALCKKTIRIPVLAEYADRQAAGTP